MGNGKRPPCSAKTENHAHRDHEVWENRAVSSWTKSDAFGLGIVGQGTISRSFATSIMTRPARWTGTKV